MIKTPIKLFTPTGSATLTVTGTPTGSATAKQNSTGITYLLCGGVVLLLLILTLRLLYNDGQLFHYSGLSQSTSNTISDVILGLSILFSVFFMFVLFFPGTRELGELITNLSSSLITLFYTFFLFYCFYTIPSETFTTYASTLVPFFLFLSFLVFGGVFFSNFFKTNPSPIYDRMNMMILFFSFIVTSLLFYIVNPGNYISNYLGPLSLITVLFSVFAFFYLILLFIVSDSLSFHNIFTFSWAKLAGIVVFLLFSILIAIGISQYPGGFFSKENIWPSLTITLLLTLVISILSVFAISQIPSSNSVNNGKMGLFKYSLVTIFGIILSGLFIAFLVIGFIGTNGIISFIINGLLILVLLAFIYRSIRPATSTKPSSREKSRSLFLQYLFYLPCLLSTWIDRFTQLYTNPESYDQMSSITLILLAILLFYLSTRFQKRNSTTSTSTSPSPFSLWNSNGGETLVTTPISLDQLTILSSYETLNHLSNTSSSSIKHNYQYTISFKFWIQSDPSKSAYQEYKSILNYGNKPDVLYRHADNSLIITMQKNGMREIPLNVGTTDISGGKIDFSNNQILLETPDEYESNGIYGNSRILYKDDKVQLQRWNHLVLNYVNGTMDIFYNGKLVKTVVEVVPYLTLDSLTVGANNGIQGKIKDVIYYPTTLSLEDIRKDFN